MLELTYQQMMEKGIAEQKIPKILQYVNDKMVHDEILKENKQCLYKNGKEEFYCVFGCFNSNKILHKKLAKEVNEEMYGIE